MKKYLLGLAAVVVALSLSAFTGNYNKTAKGKGPGELHWFVAPYGPGDFQVTTTTVEERAEDINCGGNSLIECERAFTDEQLNSNGVPSSGVEEDEQGNPASILFEIQ